MTGSKERTPLVILTIGMFSKNVVSVMTCVRGRVHPFRICFSGQMIGSSYRSKVSQWTELVPVLTRQSLTSCTSEKEGRGMLSTPRSVRDIRQRTMHDSSGALHLDIAPHHNIIVLRSRKRLARMYSQHRMLASSRVQTISKVYISYASILKSTEPLKSVHVAC